MMKRLIVIALTVLSVWMYAPAARAEVATVDVAGFDRLLTAEQGKVVLVNFFATWCGPCRMELPELVRLRGHYPNDKVSIIAISVDQDAAALEKFVAKNKIPYPVYRDNGSISAMLKISSIPLNLLLNKNGTMAQAYQGLVKEAVLVKDIDKALTR